MKVETGGVLNRQSPRAFDESIGGVPYVLVDDQHWALLTGQATNAGPNGQNRLHERHVLSHRRLRAIAMLHGLAGRLPKQMGWLILVRDAATGFAGEEPRCMAADFAVYLF